MRESKLMLIALTVATISIEQGRSMNSSDGRVMNTFQSTDRTNTDMPEQTSTVFLNDTPENIGQNYQNLSFTIDDEDIDPATKGAFENNIQIMPSSSIVEMEGTTKKKNEIDSRVTTATKDLDPQTNRNSYWSAANWPTLSNCKESIVGFKGKDRLLVGVLIGAALASAFWSAASFPGDTTGQTTGQTTGFTTGFTTGLTTGPTTGSTTGPTTGLTTGLTTGFTTTAIPPNSTSQDYLCLSEFDFTVDSDGFQKTNYTVFSPPGIDPNGLCAIYEQFVRPCIKLASDMFVKRIWNDLGDSGFLYGKCEGFASGQVEADGETVKVDDFRSNKSAPYYFASTCGIFDGEAQKCLDILDISS